MLACRLDELQAAGDFQILTISRERAVDVLRAREQVAEPAQAPGEMAQRSRVLGVGWGGGTPYLDAFAMGIERAVGVPLCCKHVAERSEAPRHVFEQRRVFGMLRGERAPLPDGFAVERKRAAGV